MFLPCLSALLNTDHYMTFFSYIFEKKKKERKTDRKKERSIIKTNRNKRRKEWLVEFKHQQTFSQYSHKLTPKAACNTYACAAPTDCQSCSTETNKRRDRERETEGETENKRQRESLRGRDREQETGEEFESKRQKTRQRMRDRGRVWEREIEGETENKRQWVRQRTRDVRLRWREGKRLMNSFFSQILMTTCKQTENYHSQSTHIVMQYADKLTYKIQIHFMP